MKRELPIVNIEGAEFLFDINEIVLIEKNNPKNRIYFHSMKDCGTHYEFMYSGVSKKLHSQNVTYPFKVFGIPSASRTEGAPIPVRIPRIAEIDPVGFCRKYCCTKQDIENKSDFEIIVDQDIFCKRMDGVPVTLEFPVKRYEVDVANNLLRPVDEDGDTIYLDALYPYYSVEREAYYLYYNAAECKFENPFQDGTWEKPPGRIVVEIPQLFGLDPIGTNLAYGNKPRYGLIYRDLKMDYTARVVPWKEHSEIVKEGMHPAFLHEKARPSRRELPTKNIQGTDFIVDIGKFQLKEKGNEQNVISFSDMEDFGNGYSFEYCSKRKNIADENSSGSVLVEIPEFVHLDPVGMAQKYGLTVEEVRGKTDFDFMVDQHAFDMRVNKGKLPAIDIAGHLFYVDMRMDMLRPKDDFLSNGIVFEEIDHYFSDEANAYIIPYNPKTHEFQELDYDSMKEFPKDLIAIQFPFQRELDPVGWNREGGWDLKDDLKRIGVKGYFRARTILWQQTFLPEIIKMNQERERKEQQKTVAAKIIKNEPKKTKGRRM